MKKYAFTQIIKVEIALLGFRLLSYIPMRVLYLISIIIEYILYSLTKFGILKQMAKRYHITKINLTLCFPNKSQSSITQICRQTFRESILVYLNYGILFFSSQSKLRSRIECIGLEQFHEESTRHPIIVVVPHFCAFDIALNRVSQEITFCSSYKAVDNYFYEKLKQARLRFVKEGDKSVILPANGSIKSIINIIKDKVPFFYLPDLDYGESSSVYIPFLGHGSRASLNTVPRLANITQAKIYTCNIYRHNYKYVFEFQGPIELAKNNSDLTTQVKNISKAYENNISKYPEHYRWYFPIFNTQPDLPNGKLYE